MIFIKLLIFTNFLNSFLKKSTFLFCQFIFQREISEYYESPLKIIPYTRFNDLKVFNANKYKWYEIDDEQDLDLASIKFSDAKRLSRKYLKDSADYADS